MNRHYEDAKTFINEATDAEIWDAGSQPVVAAMAQAEATLALAHAQHTANLIALWEVGGDDGTIPGVDYEVLKSAILERLGL